MYELTLDQLLPRAYRLLCGWSSVPAMLEQLFPAQLRKLRRKDKEDDLIALERGQLNKYIHNDPAAARTFRYIRDNILSGAKNGTTTVYSFSEYALCTQIKGNWTQVLEKLPQDTVSQFSDHVQTILHSISADLASLIAALSKDADTWGKGSGSRAVDQIVKCLIRLDPALQEKNRKDSFLYAALQDLRAFFGTETPLSAEQLTCLTLLAATAYYWVDYASHSTEAHALALVILPIGTPREGHPDWRESIVREQRDGAAVLLAQAKTALSDGLWKTCAEKCQTIIGYSFADSETRGDAYYYLAKCYDARPHAQKAQNKTAAYMKAAISLGSQAVKNDVLAWRYTHMGSIVYTPTPADAPAALPTRILANAENERVRLFRSTCPGSLADKFFYSGSATELVNALVPDELQLCLLVSDDEAKNFKDALLLLDAIKKSAGSRRGNVKTKLYLRLREANYMAILDTALSHMDGNVPRVYLIDEQKSAAQRLLSFHPLFYPIRSLPESLRQTRDITLHFVVLCTGRYELAQWLVREASWLACFRYPNISVRISVLSPDAQTISKALRTVCPGLFDKGISTGAGMSALDLDFFTACVDSAELENQLDAITSAPNSFLYAAVVGDRDIDNLDLAIRLREWSIRRTIHAGQKMPGAASPVIAFFCEDPDIAHLSKNMVVHAEKHGNSWYNDYDLVPFGALHERYNWDDLDGGYLEQLAQCTHLEYCGVDIHRGDVACALDGYFGRLYNRDSSMAVALSMPYRLFQVISERTQLPISPTGWSIADERAYTDSVLMDAMLRDFQDAVRPGTSIQTQLTKYEHCRWFRYMLSRGWLPSTAAETIAYIKSGNPSQQLHIARLHSCMIPWEELPALQEALLNAGPDSDAFCRFTPGYFTKYDEKNIAHTADIIERTWFSRSKGPAERDLERS
jgi:hypothetical protein